nr:hypothetical protein [Tanacetum cinerariifolium]
MVDSRTGNHPKDDFTPLKTIRRLCSVFGRGSQLGFERETSEPKGRKSLTTTASGSSALSVCPQLSSLPLLVVPSDSGACIRGMVILPSMAGPCASSILWHSWRVYLLVVILFTGPFLACISSNHSEDGSEPNTFFLFRLFAAYAFISAFATRVDWDVGSHGWRQMLRTELMTPDMTCPSTHQLLRSSGGGSGPDVSFDKSSSPEHFFSFSSC